MREKLVELIAAALRNKSIPADRVFQNFCKKRNLGSKQRKSLSDSFFDFWRNYWKCAFLVDAQGYDEFATNTSSDQLASVAEVVILSKTEMIEANKLVSAFERLSAYSSDVFPISAQMNMHPGIWALFTESFPSEESAISVASYVPPSVDIRVNTFAGFTKSAVIRHLCGQGIIVDELPYDALRIHKRAPLTRDALYQAGAFEVQDFGSQIISRLCDARVGECVLDYCAGGGGKAIAMLNDTNGKAELTLTDVNAPRLAKANARISRIPKAVVSFRSELDIPLASFDLVVVDAPCSGVGTLRRNPDKTVHLRDSDIFAFAELQLKILRNAAKFVKKGGRLVYITCSYLKAENEDVVQAFVAQQSGFDFVDMREVWRRKCALSFPDHSSSQGIRLTQTDGFFISTMQYMPRALKIAEKKIENSKCFTGQNDRNHLGGIPEGKKCGP
ncbi:MAG: RsmB/NOP family class I SAM-dependent RNA methyltransferase [Holosporales bacterium]|nr:RsmB/NOP family class I SAM-dependent RNA methyltransferase [Holosporales bacterium]